MQASVAAHRINRHDMGVMQARSRLRLVLKAGQLLGVEHGRERQNLQRDPTSERRIIRLVDDPHPASANLTPQAKRVDLSRVGKQVLGRAR